MLRHPTEPVTSWFDGQAAAYDGWDAGPFSWIREREAAAVLAVLGRVEGLEVLELGCGTGRFTRRLLDAGAARVTVVDLSTAMLERLPRSRLVALCGDAATVDVGRRFPRLLSAGMLEFVPDAGAVLANAARHAEADAALTLLVPREGALGRAYRAWHRRHGLTVRLFDEAALRACAEAAGWRVELVGRVPPFGLVARLRR